MTESDSGRNHQGFNEKISQVSSKNTEMEIKGYRAEVFSSRLYILLKMLSEID